MKLAEATLDHMVGCVAAETATPGGGAVAAVTGRLGASLAAMAVRFTRGRPRVTPDLEAVLSSLEAGLEGLSTRLRSLADEDAAAYEALRAALALPKSSGTEKVARTLQVDRAAATAAAVPLRTLRLCREGLEMLEGVEDQWNSHLLSDVRGAALLLRAAGRAAGLNVEVNAPLLASTEDAEQLRSQVHQLEERMALLEGKILRLGEKSAD
jgi:formiminotetrahydrofolate cyclodeaminase